MKRKIDIQCNCVERGEIGGYECGICEQWHGDDWRKEIEMKCWTASAFVGTDDGRNVPFDFSLTESYWQQSLRENKVGKNKLEKQW